MPLIGLDDICARADRPKVTRPPPGMYMIYALLDPTDGAVRYIGMTAKSLAWRLEGHLQSPTNVFAARWFAKLAVEGRHPIIEPLEIVHRKRWERRERHWIATARNAGALMLNIADGGKFQPTRRLAQGEVNKLMQAAYAGPVKHLDDSELMAQYGAGRSIAGQALVDRRARLAQQAPSDPIIPLSPMRARVRAYIRRHGL